MKAQISRESHRPSKRYSGVYHIQGAMVTDADLDERSIAITIEQALAIARYTEADPAAGLADADRQARRRDRRR